MQTLRLIGDSLPGSIGDIKDTVEQSAVVPTPFVGDWVEIGEPMEYVGANTMQAINASVDLTKVFSNGDPIRLKQGAGFLYFYVIGVTATVLDIQAGTDYVLANATITDFARGNKGNPTGFPFVFDFDADPRAPGAGTLSGLLNESYRFWMNGAQATVVISFDTADLSATDSAIVADLPIGPDNSGGDFQILGFLATNNFTPQSGMAKLETTSSYDVAFQIVLDTGFGTWAISMNGTGVDATLIYLT